MISRCCKADLWAAMDWYECSLCYLPCDTVFLSQPRNGEPMSDFETAVNYVIRNEGGLTENPSDPGGVTNFGISLRFLRAIAPESLRKYGIFDNEVDEQTIRNLTIDQAKNIYRGEFWDHAPFDRIINQEHCNFIFDMAVNMGIAPAIKCVQRACWAVMKKWEQITDDGILGDQTLAAIRQCGFLIMPPIRAERGSYYRSLVSNNPQLKEFLRGWYDRTYNA